VYIAAATATGAEQVAIRVGDESAPASATSLVEVRLLGEAVHARQPSTVLFVIDACHDGQADDPMLAAEHVDAIIRALDARARGYDAMIGVRPESRASPSAWPFTRHLLAALDDPASRDERGAARMSRVHELLRAGGAIDAEVQSFAFVRGEGDQVIVEHSAQPAEAPAPAIDEAPQAAPADAVPEATPEMHTATAPDAGAEDVRRAPAWDEPVAEPARPPPEEDAAPITPAVSREDASRVTLPSFASHVAPLPEPRATQPSLPAIEPLLALADGARERGALAEALAGYKAALMVAPATDTHGRASIYARIGELKLAEGKRREAELNFEKAIGADPMHQAALDALVNLATASNEVRRAIDLRRKRLATSFEPDERVAELCTIADICAGQLQDAADVALARLRDDQRAIGLLEQALDDDPAHDKALRALAAVRTSRSEWRALESVYRRLVDRLVSLGDTERAWDVCRKLGVLRRDKLHDAAGALDAFAAAVRCKPENVDSRALLAEMHLAAGDEPQAVAEFERIARYAPTRSSTYARLFGLHWRAGRTDRAWLTGSALAEVGSADMDQQLFVDQYRLDGPIRPSRSLDDAAWDEVLRAPGADDVVADVLRAIVATAAATRVEELRQARQLVALDPGRRQNATSTVSVVRSFHWAAQVLGVEPPDLYVMDSVPGGIAAVHAAAPTTALGPDVLRGLTTKDLAFLAGRHLTYYRPEHYSLICYPTLHDLSVLFLGAVTLILPDLDAPANLREAVLRKRKVLAKQASDQEKRRLAAAVARLEARGGRVDLAAWIRSVELSAQRAGLLLCGDLAVGTARLRAEVETRAIAELSLEEKRGDLLAFCVSEKLARARAVLGADARTSVSVAPARALQAG
jgi:tetratricopeptide (TPR) repeat protein